MHVRREGRKWQTVANEKLWNKNDLITFRDTSARDFNKNL